MSLANVFSPGNFTSCSSLKNWVHEHPQSAKITAIALAVLGVVSASVAFIVSSVSLTMTFGLIAGLSLILSPALFYILFQQRSLTSPLAPSSSSSTSSPASSSLTSPLTSSSSSSTSPLAPALRPGRIDYLRAVMQDTLRLLKEKSYVSPSGKRHSLDLDEACKSATLFRCDAPETQRVKKTAGIPKTSITLIKQDCLHVAQELYKKGLNPLVLNMAHGGHFGGGYMRGAKAQEEDCCRRAGLCLPGDIAHGFQKKTFYPLQRGFGLYIPQVPVFRENASLEYALLEDPFKVAFGCIDAVAHPQLDCSTGTPRLTADDEAQTREKIRTFFEMAYQNGHRSVVFGALGCGAFGNPPDEIARIALDIIQKEFISCFDKIVFAIIEDNNSNKQHNPEGNFIPFAKEVRKAGGWVIDSNGVVI